jgi:hypothetical protein
MSRMFNWLKLRFIKFKRLSNLKIQSLVVLSVQCYYLVEDCFDSQQMKFIQEKEVFKNDWSSNSEKDGTFWF